VSGSTSPSALATVTTHVCDVCGKMFPFRYQLIVHRRYHTERKPFTCQVSECVRFSCPPNVAGSAPASAAGEPSSVRTKEREPECSFCERRCVGRRLHVRLSSIGTASAAWAAACTRVQCVSTCLPMHPR